MKLKRRIVMCLCLILAMPALFVCLPSLTLQADAATKLCLGTDLPWSVYGQADDPYFTHTAETSLALELGQKVDFSAYFYYYRTSDYEPYYLETVKGESYESSDISVAPVSKSGVVKAMKKGTATITVRYKGREINVSVKVVSPKYTKRKDVQELNKAMTSLWNAYGKKKITNQNVVTVYNKICNVREKAQKCNDHLYLAEEYLEMLSPTVCLSEDFSSHILFDYGSYRKIYDKLFFFAYDKKNSIVASVSTKNLKTSSIELNDKTVTVNFNKAVTKQQLVNVRILAANYENKFYNRTPLNLEYAIYKGKNLKISNYYKNRTPVAEGYITLKPGAKKLTVKLEKKLAKGDYYIGFYPRYVGESYTLSISKAFTVK